MTCRHSNRSDCAMFGVVGSPEWLAVSDAIDASPPQGGRVQVIPMILFCPKCGLQHIDAPDDRTAGWENPPHRSHLCHGCNHIWRPADVHTTGVERINTAGKNDSLRVVGCAASAVQS